MLHNFFLAKFKCIIEKIWTSKELNTDFNVKILFQFLQFIISSGLIKFINLLPTCSVHCGELMLNFCDNRFCMTKYYCFKYLFLMIASISNICSGWYKKRFQSNTVHKFWDIDCIDFKYMKWLMQEKITKLYSPQILKSIINPICSHVLMTRMH